jgi:hypothetical protein
MTIFAIGLVAGVAAHMAWLSFLDWLYRPDPEEQETHLQ